MQRVTELLKREVSELLRRELNVQEVGLLSVNEVKVAPDLKTATVFVGFVGNRQQRSAASDKLGQRAKHIQMMLGSQLSMKWTPVLNFCSMSPSRRGIGCWPFSKVLIKVRSPVPEPW